MFKHNIPGPGVRGRGLPRLFWPAVLLLLVVLLMLPSRTQSSSASPISSSADASAAKTSAKAAAYQVPVTLYVMSQCPGTLSSGKHSVCAPCLQPTFASATATSTAAAAAAPIYPTADARFCQNAFKPVLETLPSVMTLRTEYIARLKEQDAVSCMHGAAECDGNKQQLCLQHHLPAAENRKYFQALLCHAKGRVNDVSRLTTCMTEAGVDADVQAEVLKCVDSTLGASLQVASAKQVKANSVVKSCTVFVDGAKRCIRDGGTWYDCPQGSDTAAFIKSVCDAYKAKTGSPAPECVAATKGAASQ